jgi:hypothetical protein
VALVRDGALSRTGVFALLAAVTQKIKDKPLWKN